MAKTQHFIRCSNCGGPGKVPLSDELERTLAVLKRSKEPISGTELARWMGVEATCMNMRLVALQGHGFADSRISGRKRLYWANAGD